MASETRYIHGTVNHFQNFMDPVTGVHMNLIEGTWTHAKKLKTTAQMRICLGRTWWSTCGGDTGDPFRTYNSYISSLMYSTCTHALFTYNNV